ncbi:MAG: SpoIIE family protein phosphatase [Bacteroidales bacterium]|nr:SpoIIE family protein phosphatase [Bacteroidales bacterium]MBN2699133.1 SpoIIE family protein phosphatase [Bacteroidales bacterium]
MKRIFSFSVLLLVCTWFLKAQSYQFSTLGVEDGLLHEFTYTINQDENGFLWIGTTQGLCRYDGHHFETEFRGDTLPEAIAKTSYFDSQGRLWFGHTNGIISVLHKRSFKVIEPDADFRSVVNDIVEDRNGNIYLLFQQSGILVVKTDNSLEYIREPFSGKFLSAMQFTSDGNMLVGTFDGLSLYQVTEEGEFIHTGNIEELQYTRVQTIIDGVKEDHYWIGTEDEGLFEISGSGPDPDQYLIRKIGIDKGLEYGNISSIVKDGTKRVWISDYGKGIYRFELDEQGNLLASELFDEKQGLPGRYINTIFMDSEENLWFSSQGQGITTLRDRAFVFYNELNGEPVPEITSLALNESEYWFGSDGEIILVERYNIQEPVIFNKSNGIPDAVITALYVDVFGDLWIGTEKNGIYKKSAGSTRIQPYYISNNSLENAINAIDGTDKSIWVATNNGAFSIDLHSGERAYFNTSTGLPHNRINDILVGKDGRVWAATLTSVYCLTDNFQYRIKNNPKLEFYSLAEDKDGAIWAGTYGEGVFKFAAENPEYYGSESGLKSDYAYAVCFDPEGYVWVGHRLGFSKINPVLGAIQAFGIESGFTSDVGHNTIASASDGKVIIGTTNGLIFYDTYQSRKDTIPPRLSIKSISISDVPYDPTEDIKLKYGSYKVALDFIGVDLSNPHQVSYQHMLEGYDESWSDLTSESVVSYRIQDGDYTFKLKACDGSGNCTITPLVFNISVRIPIWKAWWFLLGCFLLMVLGVFIIIKIRERNQKAIQEYLQQQLDERTKEVILQKEEIENKNRDITDSINYAQRIQASILPSIQKLHNTFSGSFVFYQPRDIVSGDFYWYDRVEKDKFIIVCADSTGHGVPGAFMSMIGTTLIKDICLRSDIRTPAQVLIKLDEEIREALNQNVETDGSNDGMDIIVAEIDLKTLLFRVSSAMRPVILIQNGEQVYVKGSRNSVGGQLDEDRVKKEFFDQEYQLKKGDIIYMFSDGYPDQFGGPLGRKFKMVRLKNLLVDICDKPMDEQYNYIKSNFFLWKEDLDQVDDVLFMGIKV